MPSDRQKLQHAVKELEEELAGLETVDDDARRLLEEALSEILEKLVESPPEHPEQHRSLAEQLSEAAERFEATHPRLTGLAQRLVNGLSQLGI